MSRHRRFIEALAARKREEKHRKAGEAEQMRLRDTNVRFFCITNVG